MTLQEWEEEKDREFEQQLASLFRTAEAPAPSRDFVANTLKAVQRAALPPHRRPLRHPWIAPLGWAALVAATAVIAINLGLRLPLAEVFASMVALGIRAGAGVLQMVHAGSFTFDVLAKTSGVAVRVLSTPAAGGGILALTVAATSSLLMLKKLLSSEKESSSW